MMEADMVDSWHDIAKDARTMYADGSHRREKPKNRLATANELILMSTHGIGSVGRLRR